MRGSRSGLRNAPGSQTVKDPPISMGERKHGHQFCGGVFFHPRGNFMRHMLRKQPMLHGGTEEEAGLAPQRCFGQTRLHSCSSIRQPELYPAAGRESTDSGSQQVSKLLRHEALAPRTIQRSPQRNQQSQTPSRPSLSPRIQPPLLMCYPPPASEG